MRRLAPILIALPLLAAASAPVQPPQTPLDAALRAARAEQAQAEARTASLEQAASRSRDEAEKLRIRQAAAAQAIEAAEAQITASDTQLRLVSAALAARRQRLAEEQQPVSSLLGGLAIMAQRPPLLAIADRDSLDELVTVRLLLDSTLPVIRRRTAALSAELAEGERLERAVAEARKDALRSREQLAARRDRFEALEAEALRNAASASSRALSTGDVALAAGENVERLLGGAEGARDASALAARLAQMGPAPRRPFAAEQGRREPPFAYRLPAQARVTDGLGAVNGSGVRSRGLTLATTRGTPLLVPADGTVRFSGAFRDYDGIIIIDHGGGWMSVLLNVASPLKPGDRVRSGDPLGRALGPIGVELSRNGQRVSPALIAGSSESLSNAPKGG